METITWEITEQVNGMMGIILNLPGGVVTPPQIQIIADAAGTDGIIKNTRRMAMIVLVLMESKARGSWPNGHLPRGLTPAQSLDG